MMKSPPSRATLRPQQNQAESETASAHSVQAALDSGALFAGRNEVAIAHGSEVYRLRLTRQNRLILTK